MIIRPAEKSQFEEITAVWENSVRATHDFLSDEDINELKPKILNNYLPNVKHLYVYVSFFNEVVGFIGVNDDNIEMLFIASWGQGGGIGKSLVEYAISEHNVKRVDVNEDNIEALGFYEHLGFKVVSRSPLDGEGKPFPILHMELKK
ncbi:MAG: GNAT family N-acetyltransferase [Desulfobacteraceae bacterium]|nr:GNAT family N-acetyltransferase [Desulfobacteraceae bacterium]